MAGIDERKSVKRRRCEESTIGDDGLAQAIDIQFLLRVLCIHIFLFFLRNFSLRFYSIHLIFVRYIWCELVQFHSAAKQKQVDAMIHIFIAKNC